MAELQISPKMSLEQAMAEVRAYLEEKKRPTTVTADLGPAGGGHFSMQQNLIHRLGDFANLLGQVDPNSKLGAPGVFMKRLVRKLIGWYSRPAQQFDRTAYEAFVQIRQDMLRQQEQIVALDRKIASADQQQLVRAMLGLFQALITGPAVRQALATEDPDLLTRVEDLLGRFDNGPATQSPVQDIHSRT